MMEECFKIKCMVCRRKKKKVHTTILGVIDSHTKVLQGAWIEGKGTRCQSQEGSKDQVTGLHAVSSYMVQNSNSLGVYLLVYVCIGGEVCYMQMMSIYKQEPLSRSMFFT